MLAQLSVDGIGHGPVAAIGNLERLPHLAPHTLGRYERFDVTITMDHATSLRFMLTERGEADPAWVSEQLATLGPEFVFHSYLAEITPT